MVLIAIVVAMIISSFVTNEKWNFPFAFEIMQQTPVIEGLWKGTIFGTVGAMILGIGLGIILAVMRLSTNPVLRGRRLRLHLVLPRHPPLRPAGAARHRHRLPVPRLRHRAAVRPADRRPARHRHEHDLLLARLQQPSPARSGSASSAWDCPRPPTWPRSPAPASCRSTRARPRPRRRSACRPARPCAASCCRRPCGSSCRRPATRPSPWSRTPRCSRRCPSSSSCSTRATSSASAASRSCPASSRPPSGTSSSARS